MRYVVDFGGPRPYPAHLREHSPDYGTYRGKPRAHEDSRTHPGFTPASELPRPEPPKPPVAQRPLTESRDSAFEPVLICRLSVGELD